MNGLHRKLIAHEAGHALVGLLSGFDVERVWAPPPPDMTVPPADPDAPAGFVDFKPGGDRRAKALTLLGGLLVDGKSPAWPIVPDSDDERKLAAIVSETDELTYLECVRDTREVIASSEFDRMNTLVSELLAHPPHELTGEQLKDIKAVVNAHRQAFPTRVKTYGDENDRDADRDELGVISDAQVERDIEQLQRDTAIRERNIHETDHVISNGNRPAKSVEAVRAEAREWAFKSLLGTTVQIASFEC